MAELVVSMREDGSWTRVPRPRVEASPDDFKDGVACKDVTIKQHEGEAGSVGHEADGLLGARIYLPQTHTNSIDLHNCPKVCPSGRLPVVLYFHGGGFVFVSITDPVTHRFLHSLAKTAQVIVISVEYRLAPEHRLPAAYDDGVTALLWLQSQASALYADDTDPWLRSYADFSRCYLMGDSAGGNIVYNLSLKLASLKIRPLQMKGHVLIHPYFGGVTNTETEEIKVNDTVLSLKNAHWGWELALPKGADRDHSFSNPMTIPASVYENAQIAKSLVAIALGDPMKDRQLQYSDTLKQAGVDVHVHVEDGNHGFYHVGEQCGEKATYFIKDVFGAFLHACG